MPVPTFTQLKLKKPNQGRVDFKPKEFRRLIETKGMLMTWEQATRCPCERIMDDGLAVQGTGEFQADCPSCYGRGVVYHSPTPIQALFEDVSINPKRFAPFGESASGMAGITLLPEHCAGFLDRFTLTNCTMRYEETRLRRATVERVHWPIVERNIFIGDPADPTEPLEIAVDAIYSRKADALGNISPIVLAPWDDFTVVDGQIDWTIGDTAGTAPAVGERYSMSYFGHPTYIVSTYPYSVRDTFIKFKSVSAEHRMMPTRTMCWLEYLGRPEWPQQGNPGVAL